MISWMTIAFALSAPAAGATVHVALADISRADAPAIIISEARVPTDGRQVPIPFELSYDPSRIDESHTYHLRASIRSGEKMLFTTAQAYPVLTRGAGREAELDSPLKDSALDEVAR